MFVSLLRLAAIRPLLAASVMGVPLLVALAAGLLTVWVVKLALFVLPFVVAFWLVRTLWPSRREPTVQTP